MHPRSDMGRESAGLTVQKSEITGVTLKVGTSDTRIVCEPFFFSSLESWIEVFTFAFLPFPSSLLL